MSIHMTSYHLPLAGGGTLHLRRFYTDVAGPVVFMLHGSVENGGIFYSKSMKGLAPYLAHKGMDVYVADLRGRGQSRPHISARSRNTQLQAICEEIPAFLDKIELLRGPVPVHAVAHSWGGVMLLAYLCRFPQRHFASMVFLGTKRSISVWNWERLFKVDIFWKLVGELAVRIKGFYPARALRAGSDDESAQVYRDCRTWVSDTRHWIDPTDGFDYLQALKKAQNICPTLYMTGVAEKFFGHPTDVQRLMAEVGNPRDEFRLLSKANGNLRDYGHIDICTYKRAPDDHFREILAWIQRHRIGKTTEQPTVDFQQQMSKEQ